MTRATIDHVTLILISFGVLFSGYLSAVKFFSDNCAFGESCPYFMGYPACYYGFVMFVAMLIAAVHRNMGAVNYNSSTRLIGALALLGLLFSGYFVVDELPRLAEEGFRAYVLGLPTCALGFIAYLFIGLFSILSLRRAV